VSGVVRAPDIVARYGGEEIAVILPGADSQGAVEIAERVRTAIEALRLTREGNPVGGGCVTASIGAATALARQGGTIRMPESLLLAADNAMYKAKQGGRNRVATAVLVAPKD
jgi:diguanylate cyclase (GGDEF)-like protein